VETARLPRQNRVRHPNGVKAQTPPVPGAGSLTRSGRPRTRRRPRDGPRPRRSGPAFRTTQRTDRRAGTRPPPQTFRQTRCDRMRTHSASPHLSTKQSTRSTQAAHPAHRRGRPASSAGGAGGLTGNGLKPVHPGGPPGTYRGSLKDLAAHGVDRAGGRAAVARRDGTEPVGFEARSDRRRSGLLWAVTATRACTAASLGAPIDTPAAAGWSAVSNSSMPTSLTGTPPSANWGTSTNALGVRRPPSA